ncbi:MAG TPA: hypothetical protein VGE01_04620 [Fimbriimonas sp.]
MSEREGGLSRRGLIAGGLGTGLLGRVWPAQGTITSEEVASGLACCTGAVDFALVLGLKADLQNLQRSAHELTPRVENLAREMPKLVERLKRLAVQPATRTFAEATASSTEEMARSLRLLKPRLEEMLSDEVLSGQTSDSIALFVSKTSSVASLIAQVAHSLVVLRRALEAENIGSDEYENFIAGKMDAWGAIIEFLQESQSFSQNHQALSVAAKNAKARIDAAVVSLNGSAATGLGAALSAGLAEDLRPVGERVRPEDAAAFAATLDLLGKLYTQVGKPEEDPVLLASLGGGYAGLRERVASTLATATERRATGVQVGVVVLAARCAILLPSRSSQKNVVATVILTMVPRLAFAPRNLKQALVMADSILTV